VPSGAAFPAAAGNLAGSQLRTCPRVERIVAVHADGVDKLQQLRRHVGDILHGHYAAAFGEQERLSDGHAIAGVDELVAKLFRDTAALIHEMLQELSFAGAAAMQPQWLMLLARPDAGIK
jgi:hypothetical protein